jgi:hypothetical protein
MRKEVRNRFRQVALPDEFLDAGALPRLHDRYGLSAGKVAKTIRELGWVAKAQSDREATPRRRNFMRPGLATRRIRFACPTGRCM